MKQIIFVAVFIISLGVVASGNLQSSEDVQISIDAKFDKFDVKLLKKVNQTTPGNVLLSPESIRFLLEIILEGSKGSTEEELKQALGLDKNILGKLQVKKLLHKRRQALKSKHPDIKLLFENKILLANGEKLNPKYLRTIQNSFAPNIDFVDFSNPVKVVTDLNQWINTTTKGLIPNLITPADIDPSARFLLANSIYFKGYWFVKCFVKETREEYFYNDDETKQLSYMMKMRAILNFARIKELDADVVEIPFNFRKDPKYSMMIILPAKKGLDLLLEKLASYTISKLRSELKSDGIVVTFPRFTIDYSSSLVKTLQSLGISELFSAQANLTGILSNNSPLAVKGIIHKAKIEVDEEGDRIPSMIAHSIGYACEKSQAVLKVDRTFVFFIYDKQTGANIFEGILKTPDPVKNPVEERNRILFPEIL